MKLNRRIITVMICVCSLFLVMVLYLSYFTLFQANDIIKSSANKRIWEKEEKILRGTIYDRSGTLLAKSEQTKNGQKRIYPYGSLYTHSIGYNCRSFGKTNIELKYNDYMLKTESVIDALKRGSYSEKTPDKGADLELTLDHGMTKLAKELMGTSSGSVVALSPKTGEIYCLYSGPSFDPNEEELIKNWEKLSESSDAPFVSRAVQGLYAPGSTFKIVTAAAGIEEGYGLYRVSDKGKITIDGGEIKNAGGKAYGDIGMSEAIKYSSNVYFASLSEKIGKSALRKKINEFCISENIPFDIPTKASEIDFEEMDKMALASTAIGQGKLLVTPLHMALTAAAVANGGIIMRPYMVNKAYFENGSTLYSAHASALKRAMDIETAETIGQYMKECVERGTGTAARVRGVTVAGKTGTAENEKKNLTHAWFICYAPAENPQIAICVMKEYSGSGGGSVCAPVASKLINYAISENLITAK